MFPTNKQTKPQLELECSPGGFCAEGRTVLGEAQDPRVRASLGFYCSSFTARGMKKGMGAEEKGTKQIDFSFFLVPNPRPVPDGPRASVCYGRLRELNSPLSVINCDQLLQLFPSACLSYNKFPPPKDIPGLLSNIQTVGLFCVILVLFPFEFSGTL